MNGALLIDEGMRVDFANWNCAPLLLHATPARLARALRKGKISKEDLAWAVWRIPLLQSHRSESVRRTTLLRLRRQTGIDFRLQDQKVTWDGFVLL